MTEVMEELEKILLQENTDKIQAYEAELKYSADQAQRLLNRIIKNGYPIKSASDIPRDSDEVILKLLLQRNRDLKKDSERWKISLNDPDLIIPSDLKELRNAFNEWNYFTKKELAGFLLWSDSGFILNDGAIERDIYRFAETQRIYATQADQIERYNQCKAVLDVYSSIIQTFGFNFNVNQRNKELFESPLLVWRDFPLNRYQINIDYVLTGKLQ
jgi:hypothetical protein